MNVNNSRFSIQSKQEFLQSVSRNDVFFHNVTCQKISLVLYEVAIITTIKKIIYILKTLKRFVCTQLCICTCTLIIHNGQKNVICVLVVKRLLLKDEWKQKIGNSLCF